MISGDTFAAEDSFGFADNAVLDVLLSDSTREELNGRSLMNTLPITKKNKYTVVIEAQNECTSAAYALENSLQKAYLGSTDKMLSPIEKLRA